MKASYPALLSFLICSASVPAADVPGAQVHDHAKAGGVSADFKPYAIDEKTAPRPAKVSPADTRLPLALQRGDRVVLIGNTLFDRGAEFPHFEAMLQAAHPEKQLVVRTIAWAA